MPWNYWKQHMKWVLDGIEYPSMIELALWKDHVIITPAVQN